MKRWKTVLLVSILLVVAVAVSTNAWQKHERRKRELGYQAALHSYLADLMPGIKSRKDVEAYLQSRHILYSNTCCREGRNAYAAVIQVGVEDTPWYCSENNVYIAFQFASEPGVRRSKEPTDTLKEIKILHELDGCL